MSFSLCWPRTGSNLYSSISGGESSSAGASRSSSDWSLSLGSWHSKSSPVDTSQAAMPASRPRLHAADDLVLARSLDLVANDNLVTRMKQLAYVCLPRVVRDAAHRRPV